MPASFVEDRRRQALEVYEREPVPTWRRSGFWTTHLRGLRLDELEARHYEAVSSVEELPEVVTAVLPEMADGRWQTADGEGSNGARDPSGSGLSGLIVQRGASVVWSWLDPAAAAEGVVLTSLEHAVEEHPELVE